MGLGRPLRSPVFHRRLRGRGHRRVCDGAPPTGLGQRLRLGLPQSRTRAEVRETAFRNDVDANLYATSERATLRQPCLYLLPEPLCLLGQCCKQIALLPPSGNSARIGAGASTPLAYQGRRGGVSAEAHIALTMPMLHTSIVHRFVG